jgi:hypothetical protein
LRHERFTTASVTEPKKSWLDRSELASLFIRSGDTVCDVGSGAQGLRRFLPENVGYIPVDRNDAAPGTFLCDLNKEKYELPPYDFNVIVALGLLDHLDDIEKFMTRLVELCAGKFIIFTYDFWKIKTGDVSQPIKPSFKELEEGTSFFSKYIRNLTTIAVLRRRAMFTGNLGSGTPAAPNRASATRLACRNIRPQEYLAIKLFDIEMISRWLA